jgi:hypothetical protein
MLECMTFVTIEGTLRCWHNHERSQNFWTMVSPLNLQLLLMVYRCHKAKIIVSSMVKL